MTDQNDEAPYNVQFVGSRPVFIDTPSFIPRTPGDYWTGYRQFCMLFLYHHMLEAHVVAPFQPRLRVSVDVISPQEFRYLLGFRYMFR